MSYGVIPQMTQLFSDTIMCPGESVLSNAYYLHYQTAVGLHLLPFVVSIVIQLHCVQSTANMSIHRIPSDFYRVTKRS